MLSTMGIPISGRPCLLASELCLSVFGWFVSGSLGSCIQTKEPQIAPPQLTIFTLPFLSPVNHVPIGSAARAGAIAISASAIAAAATIAVARKVLMKQPPHALLVRQGKRIAYERRIASFLPAKVIARRLHVML